MNKTSLRLGLSKWQVQTRPVASGFDGSAIISVSKSMLQRRIKKKEIQKEHQAGSRESPDTKGSLSCSRRSPGFQVESVESYGTC